MDKVQSLVKLHILTAIASGPISGYELLKVLSDRSGGSLSPSQVYPFLSTLRKEGLVRAESPKGGREVKKYSLTPEGRSIVGKILLRMEDVVDFAVKKKLKKCSHCQAEIYSGEFRKGSRYFCCPHCAAASSRKGHEACCRKQKAR